MDLQFLVAYSIYDGEYLIKNVRFSDSDIRVISSDIVNAVCSAYTLLWNMYKGKTVYVFGVCLEELL